LQIHEVMMEENGERRLPFDGAVNFRDLGGYEVGQGRRTRWRCLYRSDSLADLTEGDLARLSGLNLHGLIDFRMPQERQSHPNRLPSGATLRTVEIGFWPEGVADMLSALRAGAIDVPDVERRTISQYRHYPLNHKAEYRLMMETIEEAAGRPMLLHCVSGKDRTGFGSAVMLMALGATQTVILEDYVLSNAHRRDISHLMPPGTPAAVVQAFTAANPLYLEAAFATIHQTYGSVDAYLEQGLGLDDKRRANLRDLLTEVAPRAEPRRSLSPMTG
jgi:protein-tyrosine phosphatase